MTRSMLVAGVVAGALAHASPQDPALPDLLTKAGIYAAEYRGKVSGVTLEEQFMLIEMRASQMTVPRRLASDLILLDTSERLLGMRDLFSIDTKPTRERKPRVVNALKEPTRTSWNDVQNMAREGAHYFAANVVLWYSDPMLAIQFIEDRHQARSTFKLEGRKRLNNVQVYGVGFKEKQFEKATYLLDTETNPASSGRIWVDPATGAIHQTELWVESKTDSARIQVTYGPDQALNLILPRESMFTFDWREFGTNATNLGPGSRATRLSFEGNAKYSKATHTPIDLRRIGG